MRPCLCLLICIYIYIDIYIYTHTYTLVKSCMYTYKEILHPARGIKGKQENHMQRPARRPRASDNLECSGWAEPVVRRLGSEKQTHGASPYQDRTQLSILRQNI